MQRFLGTASYQMDDRLRVPVPPRFRQAFDPVAYVTNGAHPCVVIRTPEGFAEAEAKILALPDTMLGEEARVDFYSSSMDQKLDTQGRLTLDRVHANHAGLVKEVVVIGAGTELQIWDRSTWEAREEQRKTATQRMRDGVIGPAKEE